MAHRSRRILCALCTLFAGANVHGQTVEPSNLPATWCAGVAAPSLNVTVNTSLNTHTDCSQVRSQQPPAPDLCIFIYQDVSVGAGATLALSGSRLAVITAFGNIDVAGTINAGLAGPGFGSGDGIGGTGPSSGGGGAGGITQGAHGGSGFSAGNAGGNGGAPIAAPVLVPLLGGAHGGAGGDGTGHGGHGGGAVQLSACGDLLVEAGARIGAPGGGGSAGVFGGSPTGGGGGGSGGGVLLEGRNVTLGGTVTANGGGGGAGTGGATGGENGLDGRLDTTAAAGGNPGQADAGGSGGANTPPTSGTAATNVSQAGGGGGGAAGHIRINACTLLDNTIFAAFSPAPTMGFSCPGDRIFASGFE
jgi:hypothetical protein